MILVALALAASAPTQADAKLLGELLANAAQSTRTEVVSQGDVKRAADLDADRQLAGDCSESCMSEVAAAMGARFVLDANLGTLGDETVCTLSLYDSSSAKSERRVVRAATINALMPLAEAQTKEAVGAAVGKLPAGPAIKVLVLDVTLRAPEKEAGPPVLGIVGGVGLGVGALAAGGGVVADVLSVQMANGAAAKSTAAKDATAQRGTSDALAVGALVGYVGGAIALVAGTGFVVAQLLSSSPDDSSSPSPSASSSPSSPAAPAR
jgi:hypothetical protein